ncbi:MAG TPA: DNA polymerase/3'-5' exonuclease PolX [Longimicrobiales bacterium]|nr:DNA polymerase/3'-5' exonuclease PolX [Longimicrobiales bacterium]
MENVEIASALNRMADLLEIQDANPFRVRAYRNAVRTVENQTRPMAELCAEGFDLTELPGIGEDICGYIHELVNTGEIAQLAELEGTLPGSIAELLRIEGLGPKRVRLLHDRLNICSLDDLDRALRNGKLEGLKGFGPKTIERIGSALGEPSLKVTRFRWIDAQQFVEPLLAHLRAAPGIERVEAAGSYRRHTETVGDIDLLAICAKPAAVMKHFLAFPDVARTIAHGSTRGTIVLHSGLHVDLRILPKRCYGAAMHYFTGSKAHNIAVRKLGVERGLRISEYGVFRLGERGGARRIGGQTEEDVFQSVGMDWVPPELREDQGEIEAALAHELPALIEVADIRGDLQMHTDWTDGTATAEAMIRGCRARGYRYCAITDHSQAVAVTGGLEPRDLARQWKELARVARAVRGIRVLRSMEVDIRADGTLDLPDSWLERLDLVVVSVHSNMGMSRTKMTDRVLRAIEHPSVDILGHPTGRLINQRPAYEIDIEEILQAAARLDVAVELNAQPERLDLADVLVRRARDLGVRIAINSDAHSVESLRYMELGVAQARRGWLTAADVINTWPLARLQKWLARRSTTRVRKPRRAARTTSSG